MVRESVDILNFHLKHLWLAFFNWLKHFDYRSFNFTDGRGSICAPVLLHVKSLYVVRHTRRQGI